MAKLHEIIAVEADLEGNQKRIVDETNVTFSKKAHLFQGKQRSLTLFRGDDEVSKKAAEDAESKVEILATTVHDKLAYTWDSLIQYWDAVAQKERTNQEARADVVVNGTVVMTGVPVTFLLGLESKLKRVREIYEGIPTLEPNIKWEPAPNIGENVMVAPSVTTLKTQKETDYRTVAPATDKHQAQVVPVEKVANIGSYTDTRTSGLVTPAQKSDWLERIDTLLRAVKQARQRANETPLIDIHVGSTIMKFIHGNELDGLSSKSA